MCDSASNNTINENSITANGVIGVSIDGPSDYNSISGNSITDNAWEGIWLGGSNNSICGNNIANNWRGILLTRSSDNTINGNNITDNDYGIWLYGADYNSVCRNNMTSNGGGIGLDRSSNNTIHHNNFVGNGEQAHNHEATNVWDDGYPSGGNYWSDYAGGDMKSGPNQDQPDSDGIGDTPYAIDEDNLDNYPLVLGHDLTVSLSAPPYVLLGSSALLMATVHNCGSGNETDVELQLQVSGIRVANVTIPELISGSSHTLNFVYAPTIEGTYDVTAYAPPVPDETVTINNVAMKDVYACTSIPIEAHDANAMWIEPSFIDLTGVPVGHLFNITVAVNMTLDQLVGAWQTRLLFDPTYMEAVRVGYTDGYQSNWFAGLTTNAVPSRIFNEIGYVLHGEGLVGPAVSGRGSGTLFWIEFNVTDIPNEKVTITLDITTTYPGETFVLGHHIEVVAMTTYDASVVMAPVHELTVTSSSITGIPFTINGTSKTTSYTGWLLEGSCTLEMPETHGGYVWSHWLEDGDTNRTKTVTVNMGITLTGVFYHIADLNHDNKVDMEDVRMTARAFGSYPEHDRWNPAADVNGDEKVDMRDLRLITKNFGKTT